ncbi:MAG: hypothetical protein JSV17_10215 [Candidatus Aminicenantes bacterium]|nr:MAG: hypothetical protein JSV17_10215 [Candidatus Aminicenantes bacterium]
MLQYSLEKRASEEKLRFYLESSTRFRFPFYDPENPYRKNGLFVHLEETLMETGEKFQNDYGENFVSINLRGSWLRGIPLEDDDIDLLFIVRDLPEKERVVILEHSRQTLRKKNGIFKVCEGKQEDGIQVDPITFLNLEHVSTTIHSFMYGFKQFLEDSTRKQRDNYQDSFFGSRLREKLITFLKSGILIPYVGWIYGKWKKKEVFTELSKYLPIPSEKTGLYEKEEIEKTKEILRQTFIARNLIYPAINLKEFVSLSDVNILEVKKEAMALYRSLEALERIYARAIMNYLYTSAIELKLFGKRLIKKRVMRFSGHYDKLVDYILHVKF